MSLKFSESILTKKNYKIFCLNEQKVGLHVVLGALGYAPRYYGIFLPFGFSRFGDYTILPTVANANY
jgi:hypothetical protein